jgi:hypothetical protein
MNKIRTIWLRDFYDPLKPVPVPEPKEIDFTQHHLVYAAMLDGVRGKEALEDYTKLSGHVVGELQRDLARAGYIRLGKCQSRVCYVLYDEPNTYFKPALTPNDVHEIGVLAKTRGYTQADLANHFNVQRWVIADAMQGRKQYRESRV